MLLFDLCLGRWWGVIGRVSVMISGIVFDFSKSDWVQGQQKKDKIEHDDGLSQLRCSCELGSCVHVEQSSNWRYVRTG